MWKNNSVSGFFGKALCLICPAVFLLSACTFTGGKKDKETTKETAKTVSEPQASGNATVQDSEQEEISKSENGGEDASSVASASSATATESRSSKTENTQSKNGSSQSGSGQGGNTGGGNAGNGNSSSTSQPNDGSGYNSELDGEYVDE